MRKILLYLFIASLSILSFKFLNANTTRHDSTSDDHDETEEDEDRTNDHF